jgi:hypothetical protein
MSDGDPFPQLDGASHQAVEDNAVLDVALIADDDGMGLIRPQADTGRHVNLLSNANVTYERGCVINIR